MEPFKTVKGVVLPIDRSNVDTDAIIPKQYLKSVARTGFGANLFDEWRYLDHCLANRTSGTNDSYIFAIGQESILSEGWSITA